MARPVASRRRSVTQLAHEGFAALVEKLGLADAIRYVQLFHEGEGNYTRERHQWLDQLSHAEVARLMAKAERNRASRPKR